jgi:2-succinyl-5-enolpyruvyl-6-hydroxy-3-cyclohexene-1-carboxylate synthase
MAISAHPQLETFVHFDERSMAFHALGYAKAKRKPAIIVTTSGTACGNLLPAIMEAHESCIPLIILTADRPYELQECGANQTTNQLNMFQNYVRWQQLLPPPEPSLSTSYLKTTIAHAIAKATQGHPGPVHLNCMFREPFFSKASLSEETTHSLESLLFKNPYTQLFTPQNSLDEASSALLSSLLSTHEKGLILLGYEAIDPHKQEAVSFIYALAETLQWPIISDVLSHVKKHPLFISYYDLICKLLISEELYPECIVHLGGRFVSKHLLSLLKQAHPKIYFHIAPYGRREDPLHLITHRVTMDPRHFCKDILGKITSNHETSYLHHWQSLDHQIEHTLHHFFKTQPTCSEPHLFHTLAQEDLSHYTLFVASSMPIRDMMNFFHPEQKPLGLYGNRGLSGIDGNIATAIGIAKAVSTPLMAIIGDQTFLHDFPSLAQAKYLKHPLILLVINNDGGNIFSFLPIYERKELCEAYFIHSHGLTCFHASAMFKFHYRHYTSLDHFQGDLNTILFSSEHHLIEIQTHRDTNLNVHQTLNALIRNHASHTLLRR